MSGVGQLPTLMGGGNVRCLVAILLVALALRVAWVATVQPDPSDGRIDDTWAYYSISRSLADGKGYVDTAERTPTANAPPGYPAFLSLAFLLPGDDIAAGRAFNVLLGVALVAGVYYLGSRLWDRRAGLLAAGIMALFPSHVFFCSLLMREPLFATVVVGLLVLTLAWTIRDAPSPLKLLVLGVVVAFAAMVRPEGFAVVPVIVLAWLVVHRSLRRVTAYAGLLMLGMALLLGPWTIRNAVQVGSPIVDATGGGVVLAEAHNPDAGGRPQMDLAQTMGLWYSLRFRDVPEPERDVRIDRAAYGDSISYAFSHIPREFSLVPRRLAGFFRGDRDVLFLIQDAPAGKSTELSSETDSLLGVVADVYYYAVAVLMVFGLPFWVRRMRGEHLLLWGLVAAYCLMWAFLFAGLARYHFALLPLFAVLGAIGVSALMERCLTAEGRCTRFSGLG